MGLMINKFPAATQELHLLVLEQENIITNQNTKINSLELELNNLKIEIQNIKNLL